MKSSLAKATASTESVEAEPLPAESAQRTALVLNVQRMSTEDGPGIRTTVFFKGCTLACYWCHNPESISPRPQTTWFETRCIGCRTCIAACPQRALSVVADGVSIRRDLCQGCGTCAAACPSTALELLGTPWNLDTLLLEVLKDRVYFDRSAGGVTVSGGEPALQSLFVARFLEACRERGLHTALDTCGMCSQAALERLLAHSDLLLYDIKEIDSGRHKRFTGRTNERILANAVVAAEYMRSHPTPSTFWIRTPLVPAATATEANIRGIGRFIAANLQDVVSRWELCAFNNLCRDKYVRLGETWRCVDEDLLDQEALDALVRIARASGVDPDIVVATGATRIDPASTAN